MQTTDTPTNTRPAQTAPELALTMTRILKNPLAALRASMEGLQRDLPADDPRSAQVRSALDEVVRLSRGVQDIVDYAAPRELEPMSCTSEELLYSTVRMLPETVRSKVSLARSGGVQELFVDGPQLCQSLRHLVEHAAATTSNEVLFGARADGDAVLFTLVSETCGAAVQVSTQLDLGLQLAFRDIPRMGGSLTLQHSAQGATCIQVRFARQPRGGRRS